jgi:predicted transcriptional regulator
VEFSPKFSPEKNVRKIGPRVSITMYRVRQRKWEKYENGKKLAGDPIIFYRSIFKSRRIRKAN